MIKLLFKKGYTTLNGFVTLALLTVATLFGVEVPIESFPVSEELVLLITSIVFGIVNRFRTTTAVGES